MLKLSLAAALVGLSIGGLSFALPAAAESVASCRDDMIIGDTGTKVSAIEANADTYVIQLRQRGYNVDTVQDWGGCVRAFINDPNGGSHMEFFDPDTLEPLTTN